MDASARSNNLAGPPTRRAALNADETDQLLDCLRRSEELARVADNLDVVVMAGALMDMLIEKWMNDRRSDG